MGKILKVAILIDRLNVGGVEKIAIEEVKALRNLGENAYLVVLRRKGLVNDAFLDLRKNLPIIYLDDRLPNLLKFSFKFPLFNFFSLFHITYPFLIPFVIREKEFDYIIVHATYTAFTAVVLKKIKKIRYSVFIWDPIGYILERVYSKKLSIFTNFFTKLAKFLDKLIINNSDFVLAGGDAHNDYIKKINSKINIKIIPPSVHPLKKIINDKKDYILMVTAWKRGKNPEYIFKLIEKIPQIRIKMVGKWLDLSYRKEFQEKLKENKFFNNVDIVGEVSEKELSKYYSQAIALLQTNDDRGFGMPALEAAGHGTTFIIPRGQGVCKLFRNKVDGFYTKEKDTRTIVKYIKKLINNKYLAVEMGEHAWQTVKKNYSWKKHAQQLMNIIKNNKI